MCDFHRTYAVALGPIGHAENHQEEIASVKWAMVRCWGCFDTPAR